MFAGSYKCQNINNSLQYSKKAYLKIFLDFFRFNILNILCRCDFLSEFTLFDSTLPSFSLTISLCYQHIIMTCFFFFVFFFNFIIIIYFMNKKLYSNCGGLFPFMTLQNKLICHFIFWVLESCNLQFKFQVYFISHHSPKAKLKEILH